MGDIKPRLPLTFTPNVNTTVGDMARTKGDVLGRSKYLKEVLLRLAGDKELDLDCLVNFMVINLAGLQIANETLANTWGDKDEKPDSPMDIQ